MDKIKNFFKKIFSNLGKEDSKTATMILVLGIFAVVNFLSAGIFFRLDITQNKDYSISKVSKKTAQELDDVVNIKAYFSKNLPPKYLTLQQEIKDILDEYANYSGGKIDVKYIDPITDEIKKELEVKGIPVLQFNIMKNDAFEVVQGYIGVSLEYGDKQEVIPMISNTANLEYDITLALKKLVNNEVPALGLVSSNGTYVADEINYALGALQTLYQVKPINLKEEEITADIKTLMIIGPKEAFEEADLKKIDDFVMAGKSLIILADGVRVDRGMQVNKNEIGLDKLLGGYGLKINNDLILDTSNGRASFSQGYLSFMVDYPLWPKVLSDNFNQENVMVANLGSLMLPWVSSVERIKEDASFNVYYLARSTKDGWAQKDNFKLNPQENLKTSGGGGQYNFAVFASGKLASAFGDGQTDNAKIILVGDSDFVTNMFLEQNPDNLIFFQNIVDGLSLDEDLINIRSEGVVARPIKPIEKGAREALRYLNIFGMTALVLAFGLLRYSLRRKSKFIDEI